MKTTSRRPKASKSQKSDRSAKHGKRPQKKGPPRKKKPFTAPAAKSAPAENQRARDLAKQIASLALDKKALDVVILDVRGMTSYADYFVIASGESDRQVSAIGEHIEITLKNQSDPQRVIGSEGRETGNWVLLDYGEVVAHLFLADQRSFYDLEGLWADAPREAVSA